MRSPVDLWIEYGIVGIMKDRGPREEHSGYSSVVVMVDSPDWQFANIHHEYEQLP
jgi:hypothetical protein